MLTNQEKEFINYWEENRLKKRKILKQLSVGLPLGVLLVIAIFVNFFSGWDKRAGMIVNADPSLILVLLVASVAIVIFITIFSARHKWEQNEQHYKELLNRHEKES